MGVNAHDFFKAIGTFTGAARRLQLLKSTGDFNLYHDFAHSPSKLKATTSAVRAQFTSRTLVACMELHTFSSLTEEFLAQYSHSMDAADIAVVYYNPRTIAHKNLKQITAETVKKAFGRDDLVIFTDSRK